MKFDQWVAQNETYSSDDYTDDELYALWCVQSISNLYPNIVLKYDGEYDFDGAYYTCDLHYDKHVHIKYCDGMDDGFYKKQDIEPDERICMEEVIEGMEWWRGSISVDINGKPILYTSGLDVERINKLFFSKIV